VDVTGIQLKGHFDKKKEPFQKDAWFALSKHYYQRTKVDINKIFGKDAVSNAKGGKQEPIQNWTS